MDMAQFVNLGGLIGLIVYIIFQDWRSGKLKKNAENPKQLQDSMDHLSLHFNDDLTHILTEIQVQQEEVLEILRDISRNGVRTRT